MFRQKNDLVTKIQPEIYIINVQIKLTQILSIKIANRIRSCKKRALIYLQRNMIIIDRFDFEITP